MCKVDHQAFLYVLVLSETYLWKMPGSCYQIVRRHEYNFGVKYFSNCILFLAQIWSRYSLAIKQHRHRVLNSLRKESKCYKMLKVQN